MTDREGIIRLATEYMGWTVVGFDDDDRHGETFPRLVEQASYKPNGDRHWWLIAGNRLDRGIDFFESVADAYELESAIPEAKRRKYVDVLLAGMDDPSLFNLAHATPRQRSQAALAVLDTEER